PSQVGGGGAGSTSSNLLKVATQRICNIVNAGAVWTGAPGPCSPTGPSHVAHPEPKPAEPNTKLKPDGQAAISKDKHGHSNRPTPKLPSPADNRNANAETRGGRTSKLGQPDTPEVKQEEKSNRSPVYRSTTIPHAYPELKSFTPLQRSAHRDNEDGLLWSSIGDWSTALLRFQVALMEDPNGSFSSVIKENINAAKARLEEENKKRTQTIAPPLTAADRHDRAEQRRKNIEPPSPSIPLPELFPDSRENSLPGKFAQLRGLAEFPPSVVEEALIKKIGEEKAESLVRMTSLGLTLVPAVSEGKDIYEAATGYNVLTGEPLTKLERGIATFGVLTLGAGSVVLVTSEDLARLPDEIKLLRFRAKMSRLAEEADYVRGIRRVTVRADALTHLPDETRLITTDLSRSGYQMFSEARAMLADSKTLSPTGKVAKFEEIVKAIHEQDPGWQADRAPAKNAVGFFVGQARPWGFAIDSEGHIWQTKNFIKAGFFERGGNYVLDYDKWRRID
ncbi:MAG TPA: pre-toxin TG domain-containing protein, partial [Bryobacteraceae bacterium]|nr:pre-toxin TG domain-containing protein [Bryobacteraceae bacterium]